MMHAVVTLSRPPVPQPVCPLLLHTSTDSTSGVQSIFMANYAMPHVFDPGVGKPVRYSRPVQHHRCRVLRFLLGHVPYYTTISSSMYGEALEVYTQYVGMVVFACGFLHRHTPYMRYIPMGGGDSRW